MVRPLRSLLRLMMPGALLALYGLVVLCYLNRWDELVAITTIPIWVWSGLGALLSAMAWPWLKSPFLLFSMIVWIGTGIAWADETPGFLRALFFRSRRGPVPRPNCDWSRSIAAAIPSSIPNRSRIFNLISCAYRTSAGKACCPAWQANGSAPKATS